MDTFVLLFMGWTSIIAGIIIFALFTYFKFKDDMYKVTSHLSNFPNVRINQCEKGYFVEIEQKSFFKKKKWKPILTYAGTNDQTYYFSSFENAQAAALENFEFDLIRFKMHTISKIQKDKKAS